MVEVVAEPSSSAAWRSSKVGLEIVLAEVYHLLLAEVAEASAAEILAVDPTSKLASLALLDPLVAQVLYGLCSAD